MNHKISIVLSVALGSLLMFGTAAASPAFTEGDPVNFPAGTTMHVSVNNDSGIEDGTATYPFNTIQEGIDAARVDDLVGVAPGTYYENVILRAGVMLVGTEPTTTIIDGSGSGTVVTMGDASLLKGFTIQHGRASFGAGIVTTGAPKITQNIIRNNAQDSGGAGAAIHGDNSSPVIIGNVITENTADTQFLSGALSFINSSSPYITNNVIKNNTGRGAINLTLPSGNTPAVMNNTIIGNEGVGIKIDARVSQSTVIVANNILLGNTVGIQLDYGTAANWPLFEYNDVVSNTVNYAGMPDMTGLNGNISIDPVFSDDFHLTFESPLIDVGSIDYYAISDFDGEARPLDGNGDGVIRSDIGADERPFSDNIPPLLNITATKEDGTVYVADTWTNQTVTVSITCSDLESGIVSCPDSQVFSTDGVTSLTDLTAVDRAGNVTTATFGPVKIDKTPPKLFIGVSPDPVLLNGQANLLTNATDDLSGVRPGPCSNIDTSSVGLKSVTCWVMDHAGNSSSVTVPYQVIYDFEGFLAPVTDCINNPCDDYVISSFSTSSTASLRFRLKDANGNLVSAVNAPRWLVPLKIEDAPPVVFPEDYQFQATNLTYDWKKNLDAYAFNWSTKGLPRHTNWLVGVQLDDGKTYYVFINLK